MTQIGFVGLGKMGGNMVHRIRRDSDHEVVALRLRREGRQAGGQARRGRCRLAAGARQEAAAAPDGLDHGAGRRAHPGDRRQAREAARPRRHDHRRRQLEVDRRQAPRGGAEKSRHRLRRRRRLRRRLGPGSRLLHDGRRARRKRSNDWRRSSTCSRPETNEQSRAAIGPRGWMRFGPSGAGHYVKMVHNGVEYGLMQAYAEGFDVFDKCEYELDNAKIAHLWGQGSVVRSWLCELAARAFEADGNELQRSRATPRTPARGAGRSRTRRARRADPGDHSLALRALPLPRQRRLRRPRAGGPAQPVRRPRRQERAFAEGREGREAQRGARRKAAADMAVAAGRPTSSRSLRTH